MNRLFLHISSSGEKKSIPFLSHEPISPKKKGEFVVHERFIAEGSFGKAICEQLNLHAALIQRITFSIKEDVEISLYADTANLTLLYAETGFFLLYSNILQPELIAQSQVTSIFLEKNTSHYLKVSSTGQMEFALFIVVIPIMSTDETLISDFDGLLKRLEIVHKRPRALNSNFDFQKARSIIQDEFQKNKPLLPLIKANINILLLTIVHEYEKQTLNGSSWDKWDPDKRAVYSMAESIILGMDDDISIKNFAIAQHLNPNRLKILFKKHMGMPPSAFRISVRMQKARQLLTETNLSIQEISILVGYINPTQFSTMFKRKMGCSPNQLRK